MAKCSHRFCKACVSQAFKDKIESQSIRPTSDKHSFGITCPAPGCTSLLRDLEIERLIDHNTFSLFKDICFAKLSGRSVNLEECKLCTKKKIKEVNCSCHHKTKIQNKPVTVQEAIRQWKCSFSATQMSPAPQDLYYCTTCTDQETLIDGICISCVNKCHKGHEIEAQEVPLTLIEQCEQALICTFAVTDRVFTPANHYWSCNTCDLTGYMGCCEACAKVCHSGHDVVDRGFSKGFFCDCGSHDGNLECKVVKEIPEDKKEFLKILKAEFLEHQSEGGEYVRIIKPRYGNVKGYCTCGASGKCACLF